MARPSTAATQHRRQPATCAVHGPTPLGSRRMASSLSTAPWAHPSNAAAGRAASRGRAGIAQAHGARPTGAREGATAAVSHDGVWRRHGRRRRRQADAVARDAAVGSRSGGKPRQHGEPVKSADSLQATGAYASARPRDYGTMRLPNLGAEVRSKIVDHAISSDTCAAFAPKTTPCDPAPPAAPSKTARRDSTVTRRERRSESRRLRAARRYFGEAEVHHPVYGATARPARCSPTAAQQTCYTDRASDRPHGANLPARYPRRLLGRLLRCRAGMVCSAAPH